MTYINIIDDSEVYATATDDKWVWVLLSNTIGVMTRQQYAHEQIKAQPYFGEVPCDNPLDELTNQAQKLDMGYGGSTMLFNPETLASAVEKGIRNPSEPKEPLTRD